MKTYKYSTKERANRVSKTLGCLGFHSHGNGDEKIYMPCKTHEIFLKTIITGIHSLQLTLIQYLEIIPF